MKLELAPRAVRDAERHARWWRMNRPAARLLFDEELAAALATIRESPEVGVPHRIHRRDYRRVLMPRTRYHVYYRLVTPGLIRVLTVWSAVRGRDPLLP